MGLKMTTITMDWTDTGATVNYQAPATVNLEISCPRCHATVTAGTVHRCGDRVTLPRKKRLAASKDTGTKVSRKIIEEKW
jgi:hypothetical protein